MPTLEQVCKRLFSDSTWFIKCLIGALLLAIPVAHFFAFGYLYEIVDRARRGVLGGEESPLPEWEDWKRLFLNGVSAFVIFCVLGLLPIAVAGLLVGAVMLLLRLLGLAMLDLPGVLAGPLIYLPISIGVIVSLPLTVAGLYQYQRREEYTDAFRPWVLMAMLRSTRAYLYVPTFAVTGFVVLGSPLMTFTVFIALLASWAFYATFFRQVEQIRRTGRPNSDNNTR
ncbi:DUF4013 domain-containing protein [Geminisphaera colitermitum]|uniref:DUF4013 domain-containing protein n=1 Tax=Geminisphaera colitermitum TaxID=1148786 RepID=UPI0005BB3E8E|nr:DUF4013 domain-containing protein [Geminisphaera colitermitum]